MIISEKEKELVNKLKNGDKSAFEELIDKYEQKIYHLCLKIIKNSSDTEEVLQEVFLTIFNKIKEFKENSSLSTWIYRIAVNLALMKIRSSRKDKAVLHFEDYYPQFDEEGYHVVPIIDWSNKPDTLLLNEELKNRIEKALVKLSEEYRVVFIMKDIEGLSNEEISEILNISVPAVKSRVHRSRLFLREELSKYLDNN